MDSMTEVKKQKPKLESITPNFGNSFTYNYHGQSGEANVTSWHYHPEIELVYVNGGAGKRQIGSHVSYFRDGDLILIGSNLPHCGFITKDTGNKSQTVIHMKKDFLGNDFFNIPEMSRIQKLLEMAKSGIAFSGKTKKKLGEKMEVMEYQSDFQRLLSMFEHTK